MLTCPTGLLFSLTPVWNRPSSCLVFRIAELKLTHPPLLLSNSVSSQLASDFVSRDSCRWRSPVPRPAGDVS